MALNYILSFGRKGERNEISVMTLFTFLAFLSLFGGALQLLGKFLFVSGKNWYESALLLMLFLKHSESLLKCPCIYY